MRAWVHKYGFIHDVIQHGLTPAEHYRLSLAVTITHINTKQEEKMGNCCLKVDRGKEVELEEPAKKVEPTNKISVGPSLPRAKRDYCPLVLNSSLVPRECERVRE